MSSSDDGIPEPVVPASTETGEINVLQPEEAQQIRAEIRAIAEQRGDDSEVVELQELPDLGPAQVVDRQTGKLVPITETAEDDEALSAEELRDAWPLLDLEERSDGLRVLPREADQAGVTSVQGTQGWQKRHTFAFPTQARGGFPHRIWFFNFLHHRNWLEYP